MPDSYHSSILQHPAPEVTDVFPESGTLPLEWLSIARKGLPTCKLTLAKGHVIEDGVFTVLPGCEWSGNTAEGGDHNVFFPKEAANIYRCFPALVEGHDGLDADAHTLAGLCGKRHAEPVDAVIYAHVGGRHANIFYDHDHDHDHDQDPKPEAAVKMHSVQDSVEWRLTNGFPIRGRAGVVANSDGHKGPPDASYPGASFFGADGGLGCFLMEENTRDSVFIPAARRGRASPST